MAKMGKKAMFCTACGSTSVSVFYPTPESVACRVIEAASLDRAGLEVLEPSAGTGNLARLAAERGAVVDCVELQAGLAAELSRSGRYRNVWQGDFLSREPCARYDRVIMNPPFENGADGAHVEHAAAFLKPGGVLVAVVSRMAGRRESRRADKAFAAFLDGARTRRTPLPENAFKSVGTSVACDLVRVEVS